MAGDDYVGRLWADVVDLESKTKWIDRCLDAKNADSLFKEVAPAVQRLLDQGAAREDLELLAAFSRSQTCFSVLVALDDPGLGKGKIAGLHKDFEKSRPKQKARNRRGEFIQWLWEAEDFHGDGKWLQDVKDGEINAEPFGKLFPALRRLLKKAKSVKDLGRFLGWNAHQACLHSLRLLEEAGFKTGDEPCSLHEMFETSYPTADQPGAKKKTGGQPDPAEPLWRIKSAQSIAFSPDSKTLAVASASSPIRLVDLATGQERLTCQGIRVHIYNIVFSPDGKKVTAGQIHRELSICDAKTGKLLHKLKRTEDEISGLVQSPGDELICSAWCGRIAVFDARTGKTLPPLRVCEDDDMVDAIALFPKGNRLAVLWNKTVGIWSWPDRKKLFETKLKDASWKCKDIAVSPDGRTVAVSDGEKGIYLLDAQNGKRLGIIPVTGMHEGIAFTPEGRHLVLNDQKSNQLCIWDLKKSREVRRIPMKGGLKVAVSRDGKFLASHTDRVASVWRLEPLLTE